MASMSKVNVEGLVKFLLKKKTEKISEVESRISDYIETLVRKSIPAIISDSFKKFPGYFKITTGVQVSGFGFNYKYYSTEKPYINGHNGSFIQVVLEGGEADKLSNLDLEKLTLEKETESLRNDLRNLIFSLKTPNKVIEIIPSSKEFFDTLIPNYKVAVIPKNTLSILKRLKDE